jgi:hypothetical protein
MEPTSGGSPSCAADPGAHLATIMTFPVANQPGTVGAATANVMIVVVGRERYGVGAANGTTTGCSLTA